MSKLPKRRKTNGADLLDEYEAAAILGISIHRLRKSRMRWPTWEGPKFVKLANEWHVRYRRRDLELFVKNRNAKIRIVDPARRVEAS